MDSTQRNIVIQQTCDMIINQGIKSVRMDDIAHEVRVSKRTLYEEFGDKEELLFQAIKFHFDGFDKENLTVAMQAPNVLIAIILISERIREHSVTNWKLRISLHKFFPNILKRLQDDNAEEKHKFMKRSLMLGVKQGIIESRIDLDLTLSLINYIGMGFVSSNGLITLPKGMTYEYAFDEIFVNFIRGISTIKGVEIIDNYVNDRKKNI